MSAETIHITGVDAVGAEATGAKPQLPLRPETPQTAELVPQGSDAKFDFLRKNGFPLSREAHALPTLRISQGFATFRLQTTDNLRAPEYQEAIASLRAQDGVIVFTDFESAVGFDSVMITVPVDMLGLPEADVAALVAEHQSRIAAAAAYPSMPFEIDGAAAGC